MPAGDFLDWLRKDAANLATDKEWQDLVVRAQRAAGMTPGWQKALSGAVDKVGIKLAPPVPEGAPSLPQDSGWGINRA